MRATVAMILVASSLLCGCKDEVKVELVNNTSVYTEGDLNGGSAFGLNPNGRTRRSVDVGGFWVWDSSSEVEMNIAFHESWNDYSPITYRKTFTKNMSSGQEYTWEIFTNANGAPALRLLDVKGSSSLAGP